MVVSSDELLIEILVRLSHVKHVIRCSAVCKRWRSLISDRSFTHRYMNRHRRSPLPYTLVVKIDFGRHYRLFSEESEALHSSTVSSSDPFSYLGIVSGRSDFVGTWDGFLFFVDTSGFDKGYFVCDPLTRRCAQIPYRPPIYQPPDNDWEHYEAHYGLACDHSRGFFAFVMLRKRSDDLVYNLAIFHSEYRRWYRYSLAYPRQLVTARHHISSKGGVTTENGVMHFHLFEVKSFVGFLAFRPMFDEWKTKGGTFIGLPSGFDTTREKADQSDDYCWGLVNGRLRLVQCFPVNQSYTLKIWELRYDDEDDTESASWVVVYDGALGKLLGGIDLCVKALHPSKRSVVFVMHNCEAVYEYDFEQRKYNLVDPVPYEVDEMRIKYRKNIDMTTYTIAHPSCPFPILDALSTDVTANDLLL